MCAPILLKFGTHTRGLKTNARINFNVNLIKIQGARKQFTHKAKLNFCHAYRVNRFKEKSENQYVAKLNNIRGVLFGG